MSTSHRQKAARSLAKRLNMSYQEALNCLLESIAETEAALRQGPVSAPSTVGVRVGLSDEPVSPGALVGYTASGVRAPVFFDPHDELRANRPAGISIVGQPGSGVSFLPLVFAHRMSDAGVRCVMIDPRGDANLLIQWSAPGTVMDLRLAPSGALSPFQVGRDDAAQRLLAIETLRGLLGAELDRDGAAALLRAIDAVASEDAPSLTRIVDVLGATEGDPAAVRVAAHLRSMMDLPFADLLFAAPADRGLRLDARLTVISMLGLGLPPERTPVQGYSLENRLAVAVVRATVAQVHDVLAKLDAKEPKALFIDQSWTLTNNSAGTRVLAEILGGARSRLLALTLTSRAPAGLPDEVSSGMGVQYAFRSTDDAEIDQVLALMGVPVSPACRTMVRDLRNGEVLMKGRDGVVRRAQVSVPGMLSLQTDPTRFRE
jgi:hypothetical protein